MPDRKEPELNDENPTLTHNELPGPPPAGIEREIFGKWTLILRNFAGVVAVLVVCTTALFNSYTINQSVSKYGEWPSELSMLIMMVGPIVVSWSWINASKIITTILEGTGGLTRLRERAAKMLDPRIEQNKERNGE